jgi:protein TonB
MLAYAANRPIIGARKPDPNAMLAIIGIHVAAIAVLMSAKMDLPPIVKSPPIDIFWVPKPIDPPPPAQTRQTVQGQTSKIDQPPVHVVTPPQGNPAAGPGPSSDLNPGSILGTGTGIIELPPPHLMVKLGPRLATPEAELKPPYPPSKIFTEEEAVLNLRLTIDQNGRVIAVDPVGRADAAFLAAARRHLLAHWRYKPASEDGHSVVSSTVITLRFELDG